MFPANRTIFLFRTGIFNRGERRDRGEDKTADYADSSDEFVSYPRPSANSAVLLMQIPTSADLAENQRHALEWRKESE
jgi:hypothetical protein